MIDNKTIGAKLKFLRTQKGYTMQKVADRFGLTRGAIAHYESGVRSIGADLFIEILEYYDADPNEIVKEIIMESKK